MNTGSFNQGSYVTFSNSTISTNKKVDLLRRFADGLECGDRGHQSQEGGIPRLNDKHASVLPQYAVHLAERLGQAGPQVGEVVQAALDDEDVF